MSDLIKRLRGFGHVDMGSQYLMDEAANAIEDKDALIASLQRQIDDLQWRLECEATEARKKIDPLNECLMDIGRSLQTLGSSRMGRKQGE